jgi:hypothetical protein
LESAAFGDLTFISGDVLLPFSGLNNYLNKWPIKSGWQAGLCFILISTLTLKMEAVCSSETSVKLSQTSRRHTPLVSAVHYLACIVIMQLQILHHAFVVKLKCRSIVILPVCAVSCRSSASCPMGIRVCFPAGKAAEAWSWPLTSI